jgi:hypothetical protein
MLEGEQDVQSSIEVLLSTELVKSFTSPLMEGIDGCLNH